MIGVVPKAQIEFESAVVWVFECDILFAGLLQPIARILLARRFGDRVFLIGHTVLLISRPL